MAKECGVPIPQTFSPKNLDDVKSISKGMVFPCVLKPIYSHLLCKKIHRKLVEVSNQAELIAEYQKIAVLDDRIILQELIHGQDDQIYIYLAYCREKGVPEGVFTGRKLRQYPPHYGTASLAESLWTSGVAEIGNQFLKCIEYEGVAGIEFKRDPRTGQFKLMEINPRLVQWHGITKQAGLDVCYAQYLDLTGQPFPASSFTDRVKWIYLEKDLITSFQYFQEGSLTVPEWWRSLKHIRYVADVVPADPLPFLVALVQLFKIALKKIVWRLLRRPYGAYGG